jgi:hypothetical protein
MGLSAFTSECKGFRVRTFRLRGSASSTMTLPRFTRIMVAEVSATNRAFGTTSAVAALVMSLVISAAASAPPTRVTKRVGLPVIAAAMDGPRVIYSSDDNAVHVWNIRSGAVTLLRRGAGRFTDNPTIREVAVAGSRTAWITLASAGNSQETWARLFTGPLARLSGRRIASAFRVDGEGENGVEQWRGDWLSGLAGSGDVLAVSRWTTTPKTDASGLTISNARLSLIEPGRHPFRVISSGAKAIVSAAVDGHRIAVLRPDDSIGIYSSNGPLQREITPSSAKEIAFGGGRVVVLTGTKTIEVYDAGTGEQLHTWRIPVSQPYLQPGHLSAYGRIGVFVVDARFLTSRLHVVDLASGKEVVLPAREHGVRDAVVGPLGLVYAVNKIDFGVKPPKRTGTFVFLSTKRVLAGIASGRLQ